MRPDLWNILEPAKVDPRVKSWKDVLRNLVYHANESGEAWPSVETIRIETGYKSRKAIISALDGLRSIGLISKKRDGYGRSTRIVYHVDISAENVDKLSNGEVTSINGEVTSINGEVTSHRNKNEYNKNSSSSSIGPNGEVTSTIVDNSSGHASLTEELLSRHSPNRTEVAPSARNDVGAVSAFASVVGVDYLALCKKPGWRPNDPNQTPPCDFQTAKRAVLACAYQQKLSTEKANEFWHYNAVRKWTAIDCGNTVAELARAFMDRWFREDPQSFWSEQARRKAVASTRAMS